MLKGIANKLGTTQNAQRILGIGPIRTMQNFGDSISGISSIYQPTNLALTNIPAWQATTAYIVGNVVKNNNLLYRCTIAGTSAGSGGPTGTTTAIADNTATWRYMPPVYRKGYGHFMTWVEIFSGGSIVWDQSQGYSGTVLGLVKILVQNGGSNYSNPTINLTGGATATATVSGGVITAVTVNNPGYLAASPISVSSITDASGSGAILTPISQAAGTLSQPGNKTADLVAALADAVACPADCLTVMCGTNDVFTNVAATTIIANLQNIYDTLLAAGKRLIIIPILPRDSSITSTAQRATLKRVNAWIRAYCRKETFANTNQYSGAVLADPTEFLMDGASVTGSPIGGVAGTAGAMTIDGVHPTARGAQHIAMAIVTAAAAFIGSVPMPFPHVSDMDNGFSPTFNPSGNLLDGVAWTAATAYALGDHVANDTAPVKVYVCTTAGTSAGSGGPTGTGSSVADNTVVWKYLYSRGLSVFAQTFDVTPTAATGIVYTGSMPHNMQINRLGGTASGTWNLSSETPWSSGQAGQRLVAAASLGSGSATEQWQMYVNAFGATQYGIPAADLGNANYQIEAIIELSAVANLNSIAFMFTDNLGNSGTIEASAAYFAAQGSGSALIGMNSSGEAMPIPNGGKFFLRSSIFMLPANMNTPNLSFVLNFNAAGGAGSATATIKFDYMGIRKAGMI